MKSLPDQNFKKQIINYVKMYYVDTVVLEVVT